MLYRMLPGSNELGGYLVYRHIFASSCPVKEGAAQHRVATFVTEHDARQYCDYRNFLTGLYGTDRVPDDLWSDAALHAPS